MTHKDKLTLLSLRSCGGKQFIGCHYPPSTSTLWRKVCDWLVFLLNAQPFSYAYDFSTPQQLCDCWMVPSLFTAFNTANPPKMRLIPPGYERKGVYLKELRCVLPETTAAAGRTLRLALYTHLWSIGRKTPGLRIQGINPTIDLATVWRNTARAVLPDDVLSTWYMVGHDIVPTVQGKAPSYKCVCWLWLNGHTATSTNDVKGGRGDLDVDTDETGYDILSR
jgi:hypothetical protein